MDVARALLEKAEAFGRSHGCDEVIGNFNLTAMQMCGVVTEIHRPYHYTEQVYAPVYVSKLLERNGYRATFPMRTYETVVDRIDEALLLGPKQKAILENPDFTFQSLKVDSLEETMETMRVCLNEGFSDNPMFVPLTKEEIYFQAKDMMLIVDDKLTVVCKHKGKPVGVVICIPNLNPFLKSIKSKLGLTTPYHFLRHKFNRTTAVVVFYSVLKDYHSQGLNGVMLHKLITAFKAGGYKAFGGTWIGDSNVASLKQAEKLGAEVMHRLHLYSKELK